MTAMPRVAAARPARRSRAKGGTRQAILDHAVSLASRIGLEGLTIGRLAEDLQLSKSGLFAHFKSKEALQVQVLETAADRFIEHVVRPALQKPRGEPRVRAMVEGWLTWVSAKGGCLFVAAATELDDRPGAVRDRLVQLQRDWLDTLAGAVRIALAEGHFRKGVDPEQVAHELHGALLGYHYAARLLKDPKAIQRLQVAVEGTLAAARPSRPS
jgi:AcrR family transcriptional regulator